MTVFQGFPLSHGKIVDTIVIYAKNHGDRLAGLPLVEGGGAKHSPPGPTGCIHDDFMKKMSIF